MIGNPTRPGDDAIVIEGPSAGTIVSVIDAKGARRLIRSSAPLEVVIRFESGKSISAAVESGTEVWADDDMLKPIRPSSPPIAEQEEWHLAGVV